jgi:hypothetical protein
MLRMQEMAFLGFKFQTFSGGIFPPDPMAFSHSYPPLIYYLTEGSLLKKCPPPPQENP